MKSVFMTIAATSVLLSPGLVLADELEEFARRFIEAEDKAWQAGDVDDLETLEAPNVVYYTSGGQVLTDGFAAHKAYILANREDLVDLDQEWEYLAGGGSVFSMAYRSVAQTRTQEITVDALFVFRLENGRIVEVWTHGTTTVGEPD